MPASPFSSIPISPIIAVRVAALQSLEPLSAAHEPSSGSLHAIPCCYELGMDLVCVADHRGLDTEAVIRLHSGTVYTVYAIGFCPGYPFLGYLPEPICGVPRLAAPCLRVEAGSIGLTGRQTGIYTEPRPGRDIVR